MTSRDYIVTKAPNIEEILKAFRKWSTILVQTQHPETKETGALSLVVTNLQYKGNVFLVSGGVMFQENEVFLLKYDFKTGEADAWMVVTSASDNEGGPDNWNYNSMGG